MAAIRDSLTPPSVWSAPVPPVVNARTVSLGLGALGAGASAAMAREGAASASTPTDLVRYVRPLAAPQGYRPPNGSDTAFNEAIEKQFASGATPIGQAVADAVAGASMGGVGGAVGGAVVGLRRGANDVMLQARMLGNGEAIARLVFDPRALPDLSVLARAPEGSRNAEMFTQRLLRLANGGASPLRDPTADQGAVAEPRDGEPHGHQERGHRARADDAADPRQAAGHRCDRNGGPLGPCPLAKDRFLLAIWDDVGKSWLSDVVYELTLEYFDSQMRAWWLSLPSSPMGIGPNPPWRKGNAVSWTEPTKPIISPESPAGRRLTMRLISDAFPTSPVSLALRDPWLNGETIAFVPSA